MKWKIYVFFLLSKYSDGFFIPNSMRVDVIRKTIDVIDDKIHDLICARIKCAEQLKGKKSKIRDPIREVSIIARLQDKERLDPVMIKNIWKVLFQESYRVQHEKDDETVQTENFTKEDETVKTQKYTRDERNENTNFDSFDFDKLN